MSADAGHAMERLLYEYKGALFPEYLKHGGASRYIAQVAKFFCRGVGLDVGAGRWPLDGAMPVELENGGDAYHLPAEEYDYIFSSHCLEHLGDTVRALEHWKSRIRAGGVLFLYLPHPDMTYWRPQHCRKHRQLLWPADVATMLRDLGFRDVIHSERDMFWSFTVIGIR